MTDLSSLPSFTKKQQHNPEHAGLTGDGNPVKSGSTSNTRSDRRPKRSAPHSPENNDSDDDDDLEIAPAHAQSPSKKKRGGDDDSLLSRIEASQNPSETAPRCKGRNAPRTAAKLKLPTLYSADR